MRRFSEASAMVAPPALDFDGAFQAMAVGEASPLAGRVLARGAGSAVGRPLREGGRRGRPPRPGAVHRAADEASADD